MAAELTRLRAERADMLAALRELHRVLAEDVCESLHPEEWLSTTQFHNAMDAAHAVIAAAEASK